MAYSSTLPTDLAIAHYDTLASQSPFSPPTAAPSTETTKANWADAYTLSSIAEFGSSYRVTLSKKGGGAPSGAGAIKLDRISISKDEENPEHITLGSVTWGKKPEETRVTLIKNGEAAVFSFDSSHFGSGKPASPGGAPAGGGTDHHFRTPFGGVAPNGFSTQDQNNFIHAKPQSSGPIRANPPSGPATHSIPPAASVGPQIISPKAQSPQATDDDDDDDSDD